MPTPSAHHTPPFLSPDQSSPRWITPPSPLLLTGNCLVAGLPPVFHSMSSQLSKEKTDAILDAISPHIAKNVEALILDHLGGIQAEIDQLKALSLTLHDDLNSKLDGLLALVPSLVEKTLPSLNLGPTQQAIVPLSSPQVFVEPHVLSNVSFTGGHTHLWAFIHVVKDILLSHPHCFASKAAKIHWTACHI
ncbi:hypothetical protein CROQUDRAFT_326103 [Cronartium quercuum f. sp. fusiforme G11]|uniref:Uncharacterized protein n=1 Tax=Cronartium quercuum f. sp. fusiforme G11 TaxID=708437 RepID=A0A9P6N7S0_9BASI|nr:hypothetical protein CROQUDRAFT_326103 [Cronartium quercuum f. sp. fusiforme G11]